MSQVLINFDERGEELVMLQVSAPSPQVRTSIRSSALAATDHGGTVTTESASRLYAYTTGELSGALCASEVSSAIQRGALLDSDSARRWFSVIREVCSEAAYTFQAPLEQASSASTRCLGEDVTLFSTYSYLGLNTHSRIDKAASEAISKYGTSAGGARLLTGTLDLHLQLEDELARFVGQPAAAIYASGYDANIAAITALLEPEDLVLIDQYAHRSLHDAVRMAGCDLKRFRHNNLDRLERLLQQARFTNRNRRILVAVDSVYSMEGDQVPLQELVDLKDRYGAFLLVDEAHSIGAVGHSGRGICEEQGVEPERIDVVTGSLAKAIPSSGGFVAGSKSLKLYLQYGSAPYFFSAAMTPANTAAALEALRVIQSEPEHIQRLHVNSAKLRNGLAGLGLQTTNSTSPIVPVILGEEGKAFKWAAELFRQRIITSAVAHPAVPVGSARLRLCATSAHSNDHFDRLFTALANCQQLHE